jgi:DNA-binding MarR family transcriptional regulator
MIERFNTFTTLIAALSRNIRRIKTEEMNKWDLKSNHVSCIYYLYVNKSLTAKQLCDICDEDKANVSRSIEFLKENGYIERCVDAKKRYKSPLVLTDKGNEIGKTLYKKVGEILSDVSDGISEEERCIMYRCLTIINNNLQDRFL